MSDDSKIYIVEYFTLQRLIMYLSIAAGLLAIGVMMVCVHCKH